jgi:hypothetical protein
MVKNRFNMTAEKIKIPAIIIDNNPISLMKYAEEYPETWKAICKSIDSQQPLKNLILDKVKTSYEGENALKRGAITNGEMESSPALIKGSPADKYSTAEKIKEAFKRCPCCNNIVTNDDCGSSTDALGYTDCCGVHIDTGEGRDEGDFT